MAKAQRNSSSFSVLPPRGTRSFWRVCQILDATTQYRHPTYGVLEARYSDIVQHVVNHGTYHRGNIAAMLRQQGYAGVPTDYVFYLYELSQQAQA